MTDLKETQRKVLEGIQKDLGIKRESSSSTLNESYVALAKTYNLPTELLSKKAKHAHKKLYENYTEQLTRISAELDTVDRKSDFRTYRSLKQNEIFYMNAVYLHELYFANISDVHSEVTMDSLSYMRLERDFGNFDNWQYDLVANAMSGASGWAVCAYSTFLQRYINFFVESHDTSIPVGCYPVVVIDVWEHAYFRDYLDDRRSYIYSMMKELDWVVIEERFKKADRIGQAIK